MYPILILLIVLFIYGLAYVFYGRKILEQRVTKADPNRPTPALTKFDGVDYVPANKYVLYGHHFASIAGRKDRLEIAFNPSDRVVVGEVYLVKMNSRVDNAILRNSVGERLDRLFSKEVKGFYDYIVFYSDESLYDKVAEAVASASLPVTMIATYPGENIVSVAYDLSLSTLSEFLAFQDRLVKDLTVPRVGRK